MSTSELRDRIVAEARGWLGTPARHRMATRGLGVDDFGLVRSVGEACGVLSVDREAFAPHETYPAHPTVEGVSARLAVVLTPIAADAAQPGDVVQLGERVAILAEFDGRPTLIRAQEPHGARVLATGKPAHSVVEHGFRTPWPERVTAWFRYSGLA